MKARTAPANRTSSLQQTTFTAYSRTWQGHETPDRCSAGGGICLDFVEVFKAQAAVALRLPFPTMGMSHAHLDAHERSFLGKTPAGRS